MKYKELLNKRVDYNPNFQFFDENDYEGLESKPVLFKSHQKNLFGKFYYYKKNTYKSIIILSHGFGGGHKAYSAEINTFANLGYIVFAYDNYGTSESEGKGIRSIFECIPNLLDAISYVRSIKELKKYKINLLGHSMGAYASGVVLKYTNLVNKAVLMSSPYDFFESFLKMFQFDSSDLSKSRLIEHSLNGIYANNNLEDVLPFTDTDLLLIYGKDDPVIDVKEVIEKLSKYENITLMIEEDKLHNPNYTKEAISYANEVGLNLLGNSKIDYSKIDFKKVCEQDMNIINKISEFYD